MVRFQSDAQVSQTVLTLMTKNPQAFPIKLGKVPTDLHLGEFSQEFEFRRQNLLLLEGR